MKDIELKDSKEIRFENGDFDLIYTEKYRVIQSCYIALKTLKRDWYLDEDVGIDYFNNLKTNDISLLKSEVRQAILDVQGVDEITNFDFRKVGDCLHFNISVAIQDEEAVITGEL